jgi:hypothetical protein
VFCYAFPDAPLTMVLFLALATRAGAPIDSFRVQAVVSSVVSLLVMCLSHPVEDGVHEREVLCRKLASRCGQGAGTLLGKQDTLSRLAGSCTQRLKFSRASYGMFDSIYVSYLSCDVTDMVKYGSSV